MSDSKWPSWRYGPNGESRVFESEVDVPAGWQDHPSKIVTPERTGSKPLPPQTDKISEPDRGAAPVNQPNNATGTQTGGAPVETGDQSNTLDAAGWPWDPKLHAATQSKTKDGLWRMRVGVTRPAPKPLDL